MRGDNDANIKALISAGGSPPHAWGQCRPSFIGGNTRRFTPTCVGTIRPNALSSSCVPVHPHMRGDNLRDVYNIREIGGSPPHAWGQWLCPSLLCVPRRFTPTCVGTIVFTHPEFVRYAVHPHMRGDNIQQGTPQSATNGSPPHAWGQSLCCSLMG